MLCILAMTINGQLSLRGVNREKDEAISPLLGMTLRLLVRPGINPWAINDAPAGLFHSWISLVFVILSEVKDQY